MAVRSDRDIAVALTKRDGPTYIELLTSPDWRLGGFLDAVGS
jgi:hypothetical protein